MNPKHFYIATILNPKNDLKCEFYAKGMLVTETRKKSVVILDLLSYEKGLKKYKKQMTEANTREFKDSVILPGFFDMHFHWVQDDVREMPKDSLLQWLDLYTFPTEAKFADQAYAEKKAKVFFKKLTRTGTLGGACYSSVHEHATSAAMKEVKGDFVIGNVLMNMNSPENLTQSDADSLAVVKRLIKKYGKRYVLTPRFAITTSPEVMKKGSAMADQARCFKQTHLSETTAEIEFVLSIYRENPKFKNVKTYTEIYQKTGMLGPRSLMGHGIHLSKPELKLLSKTKTSIIHCPTSNAPHEELGLGSGLFDFKQVEKSKVRWALGSDIGGGPFLSMFDVMRSFVDQNAKQKIKGATFTKALYRATLAGAEILQVHKKTGNLDPKKLSNFIVVPVSKSKNLKSAESVLKMIILSHASERTRYEELVSFVSLEGQVLYDKQLAHAK
jgi:guanine deaminase